MSDWLIVGLGNPGPRYAKTRHNLGFLAVMAFAEALERSGAQKGDVQLRMNTRWQAEVTKVNGQDKDGQAVRWHLFLPMTYMNCCGPAIEQYRKFYNIPLSQVVILVDDIALPFGEIRYREQGSSGGHNGLKSIQQAFGTQVYPRLRMGVSAPISHPEQGKQDLADYVLSPFSDGEFRQMPDLLNRVVDWVFALPVKGSDEKRKQESL